MPVRFTTLVAACQNRHAPRHILCASPRLSPPAKPGTRSVRHHALHQAARRLPQVPHSKVCAAAHGRLFCLGRARLEIFCTTCWTC